MSDLVTRLRTACSPESPLGKLCSEAADALETMQWRPIAAAPKDGKFRLVFCPAYEGFVAMVSWQGSGEQAQWYGVDQDGLRYQQRAADPTHWMPLPAHPPLTDEAKLRRSKPLDELGALDGELMK